MVEAATRVIAIPCFGEEVAPLFGAARRFRIWRVAGGEVVDYRELLVEPAHAVERTRLMRREAVTVVIANGIEARCRQMLEAEGCTVIDNVVGTATDALFGFLAGRFQPSRRVEEGEDVPGTLNTADVVSWTRELFDHCGWQVTTVEDNHLFPVDLIAERACPLCGRPVRVAVCCGAHAYRVEPEIREFQRVTAHGYHARVYVHQPLPTASRLCGAFGIELLDPLSNAWQGDGEGGASLPPMRGTILEHEQLNNSPSKKEG